MKKLICIIVLMLALVIMLASCDKSFEVSFDSNGGSAVESQTVKKGDTAGYDGQFVAGDNCKIAIVSIGYADGLFRNIIKKGYVLINDNFCKIVAICMDSIMVDVTKIECKICDEVILIGKDKKNQIFICDFANWCDTINYEVLTHISKRVKRKYIKG